MTTWPAVAGVAAVALAMVLTPGPNLLYLVSRSVGQGTRAGLVSLVGVVAGLVTYLLATAAGLAALFAAVPVLHDAVRLAGAAYLCRLGVGILRARGSGPFAPGDVAPHGPLRLLSMGLLTCLLNPKIALLYAALLPQFVDPARGSVARQFVVLGLVQVLVAGVVNAGWVLSAGHVGALLRRHPSVERWQRRVTGTALVGVGLRVATERG